MQNKYKLHLFFIIFLYPYILISIFELLIEWYNFSTHKNIRGENFSMQAIESMRMVLPNRKIQRPKLPELNIYIYIYNKFQRVLST